jgi:hypothetical protein
LKIVTSDFGGKNHGNAKRAKMSRSAAVSPNNSFLMTFSGRQHDHDIAMLEA